MDNTIIYLNGRTTPTATTPENDSYLIETWRKTPRVRKNFKNDKINITPQTTKKLVVESYKFRTILVTNPGQDKLLLKNHIQKNLKMHAWDDR